MKRLNFFTGTKLVVFSTAVLFAVASCKKDDEETVKTDYVGVWVTDKSVPIDGATLDIRDIVNFSKNSFTEVAKIKDPETDKWVDLVGRKGTINANDGTMNVSITEAGTSAIDIVTGMPTGVIVYYKEGTGEFTDVLTQMEMSKNYKALYTVSNNTLTLKADNNNNGSFDDEDEANTFVKQ